MSLTNEAFEMVWLRKSPENCFQSFLNLGKLEIMMIFLI